MVTFFHCGKVNATLYVKRVSFFGERVKVVPDILKGFP